MQHFDDTNYTGNPAYNSQDAVGEEGHMSTNEPHIATVIEISKANPKTVWTVVNSEVNENLDVIAGFHTNNQVIYFISNEEWNNSDESYIWYDSIIPEDNSVMKYFDDAGYSGNPAYNWQEAEGEEGFMEIYEPYITTVLEVSKTNPQTVWTVVNGDDNNEYIIAGYHLLERIHYFISNEEWKDPHESYVWFESDYVD